MSLLKVTGLCAGYGPARVLHGLDLAVEPGEVVVMLGANGAGKTTTMRALSGLIPHTGTVVLDGTPLDGLGAPEIVAAGVSLVPQGRGTFSHLSVMDNLKVGAALRKDADGIAADIDTWCGVFPILARRAKQEAGTLSGGEQQMLAVARALMSRPKLLLCDEPSLGLAPKIVAELFEVLGEVNRTQGTALLLVEQNADLALGLASRVYLLEVGRVVAEGDADRFRGDESIRRAYLGL
ncbi:ABC transporter ATP-binding protein [Actinocorallia sp. A-T 12471]|uniref:ABC transporter ATP-binding protein n=1 Tax=Actinocorallia sp. A-T 12471 TaxID=3089813 RepID=UPI0029CDCFAF|nr:ABC transporter ATP-binding protein [Actinocorallia sp. A-T 12471]MDX6741168.1 ABC transporter ATP-binding protein [Actinocorallia sp. A-T 12471]